MTSTLSNFRTKKASEQVTAALSFPSTFTTGPVSTGSEPIKLKFQNIQRQGQQKQKRLKQNKENKQLNSGGNLSKLTSINLEINNFAQCATKQKENTVKARKNQVSGCLGLPNVSSKQNLKKNNSNIYFAVSNENDYDINTNALTMRDSTTIFHVQKCLQEYIKNGKQIDKQMAMVNFQLIKKLKKIVQNQEKQTKNYGDQKTDSSKIRFRIVKSAKKVNSAGETKQKDGKIKIALSEDRQQNSDEPQFFKTTLVSAHSEIFNKMDKIEKCQQTRFSTNADDELKKYDGKQQYNITQNTPKTKLKQAEQSKQSKSNCSCTCRCQQERRPSNNNSGADSKTKSENPSLQSLNELNDQIIQKLRIKIKDLHAEINGQQKIIIDLREKMNLLQKKNKDMEQEAKQKQQASISIDMNFSLNFTESVEKDRNKQQQIAWMGDSEQLNKKSQQNAYLVQKISHLQLIIVSQSKQIEVLHKKVCEQKNRRLDFNLNQQQLQPQFVGKKDPLQERIMKNNKKSRWNNY